MIVRLLRDLTIENRFSMEKYADRLVKYLKLVTDEIRIDEVVPEMVKTPQILYILPKFNKIMNYYTRFIEYPRRLKKHYSNADIFHIIDHGYSHLAYSLNNRKVVITCHDLIPLKNSKKEFGVTSISKIALTAFRYSIQGLKKADKIIANSETTKKDIIKHFQINEDKIKVVYLGVDENFKKIENQVLLAAFKNKYGISNGKKILHVGVNYAYKNIEGILKSLAILNNSMKTNVSLIKVGTDFTDAQKKLIRELNLTDRVIYLGILPDEEMPLVYNICDILVYPSFYEGFCLPVVEAFACCLPVITSGAGSIPEVAGDSTVTINPFNEKELADAIKRLLNDEILGATLKNKGLNRSKLFSWIKTAEQTLNVYKEVYEV